MANGFIDGIGYPMNGGLAAGMSVAKARQEQERQRGLASGFTQYMNAQDDAGKRAALSQMAQYDPNTAFNLMKYEQELANKDKMTPYQQSTLDIQRQQLANQGKMNEYQTWQKEEALRKEQEAKEKEKLLGDALYRYQTATDEETKNAALADVYRASPEFAKDILKKQKEKQSELNGGYRQYLIEQAFNEKIPEEQRKLYLGMAQSLAHDPYLKGNETYEGAVGKQYAEAGMPYVYGSQEQPRQIPTKAQLAREETLAKKEAEQTVKQKENVRLAKQSSDYLDDTIKMVEETPDDVFSPFANFYQKAGVITNGMIGFDSKEQAARGEIGRRIGIVQNDILAEARAKGQTGINTMAEIRQATKGIDENSGKPALLAALRLLKSIKERLAQMPDEEGYTEPQEEIIYYEDL